LECSLVLFIGLIVGMYVLGAEVWSDPSTGGRNFDRTGRFR
jgi:hypothetical protein